LSKTPILSSFFTHHSTIQYTSAVFLIPSQFSPLLTDKQLLNCLLSLFLLIMQFCFPFFHAQSFLVFICSCTRRHAFPVVVPRGEHVLPSRPPSCFLTRLPPPSPHLLLTDGSAYSYTLEFQIWLRWKLCSSNKAGKI